MGKNEGDSLQGVKALILKGSAAPRRNCIRGPCHVHVGILSARSSTVRCSKVSGHIMRI